MNCVCGNIVEPERAEYGFVNCAACAHAGPDVSKSKGRMVYGHKTAGEIEIMSAESYDANKKYFTPNGARSAVKNFSRSICA